jgi:tRNA A-37 threonylcarbamoyl transferase component Bud32
VRWTLHLPSRKRDVERWACGEVPGQLLKENRGRAVWRVEAGRPALFVKRFPPDLFRDRARKEAALLRDLDEADIPCPRVVAVARDPKGSYLLTEEIPDVQTLGDRLKNPGPAGRLLEALGALVRKLHDAGFEHQDFHVGNVLVRADELFVIDVHRARRGRPLSRARRLEGIAFTAMSFSEARPSSDLVRFFRAAGLKTRADWLDAWERLRRHREKHYRSRQERCFKEGSGFAVEGKIIHRKDIRLAELQERLRVDRRIVIKEGKGGRVSRVGENLFLKETSPARARRIWEHAHGLSVRGIDTPRLWAWGGGWVAGEWLESVDLYGYVRGDYARLGRAEKDAFLRRLARVVRRLHDRGVFHSDLKSANVLVGAGRIAVIDLDRVRFSPGVPEKRRFFNLGQLNAALTPPLTRTDRLRFLHAYFGNCSALWKDQARWVREIMRVTVARAHHWPPRGSD